MMAWMSKKRWKGTIRNEWPHSWKYCQAMKWRQDKKAGWYELVCKMMNTNCNSKDRFVLNYSP